MDEKRFAWADFYAELADALLAYRDRRQDLVALVAATYERVGMRQPRLDSVRPPADIDPYTVFALFSRHLTDEKRSRFSGALAGALGMRSEAPTDFAGVPFANNLNATFYAFTGDAARGERDVDNLWDTFAAQLALADADTPQSRAAFVEAFDRTVTQHGLGWKLTMGLYWARPYRFVSLDSRSRWYLSDIAAAGPAIAAAVPGKAAKPIRDGRDYLGLCDEVLSGLGTASCPASTLPELVAASYVESERVNEEKAAAPAAPDGRIAPEQPSPDGGLGDEDVQDVRRWLYAPGPAASKWDEFFDAGVMGLAWGGLGDLREYASKEDVRARLRELCPEGGAQSNSALAAWQFAHDVRPGDVVYAKRGTSEVVGRGVVTGDYEYDPDADEFPNLRSVEWTHRGAWRPERRFAQKTLTEVTDYTDFVTDVEELLAEGSEPSLPGAPEPEDAPEPVAPVRPAYGRDDFLAEAFLDEGQYDTLAGLLRTKRNVILQGPPGVGKTFVAKRLAYSLMGEKDPDRVQMVQFHQSYSYEDFIEGFRPSKEGFELEKGSFYTFCKRAQDDDRDHFFVIDEINRGNLSRIFGELFMLLEADKRGPRNKLQLLYSHELFYVPANVHVIGMMNTADRSLAMLDYALRRRFAFFDLGPAFESAGFAAYRRSVGSPRLDALVSCIERLNEEISRDESLGDGFRIGHSYLCGLSPDGDVDRRLREVVEYELVPMLREYWFDEPSRVCDWAAELRRSVK